MKTKPLYMHNMQQLSCGATVISIKEREGKMVVVLDQTVFYPQGGGQPADTGLIFFEKNVFKVEHVQYINGQIEHIGVIAGGVLSANDLVTCDVKSETRSLHTRLHSAGHLIDLALKKLDIDWLPKKGFHSPVGPCVEYEGNMGSSEKEDLMNRLELMCNQLIREDLKTSIVFDNTKTYRGAPVRTVYYGDFGIECGGTHTVSLLEIGKLVIRKMKFKKGIVRVSYQVGGV